MKFGICTNMLERSGFDILGKDTLRAVKDFGFDYAELSMSHICALSDGEFSDLLGNLDDLGLKCLRSNNFVPADVRLTGSDADMGRIDAYMERAFDRARALGAEIIVFGSAGAKNIPNGFPRDKAFVQMTEILKKISPQAEAHGVKIAVEPICKREANFINTVAEGCELMNASASPGIYMLADFYHMSVEGESASDLNHAGGRLVHVHFAHPDGRTFPMPEKRGEYKAFFEELSKLGYGGAVSIEAYTDDFYADAPRALEAMRLCAEGI